MNRIEMFNPIDQLYAESDNTDESELSDMLISEGATTPNNVRVSISDENMQNSPMAKSGNKLKRRSWNDVIEAKGKRFETSFSKYVSQMEQESSPLHHDTVPDVEIPTGLESRFSLKSDISSLLKQMVKDRKEKEMTVSRVTRERSHTAQDFVTMKQIHLVNEDCFSNWDVRKI
jgi:hypothetical protein